MQTHAIIVAVYQSQELTDLLGKIHPEAIRDDLRQEIALTLLTLPSDKIIALNEREELIRYVMKICWVLAISDRYILTTRYKRKELVNAMDYLYTQLNHQEMPISLAYIAKNFINAKNRNIFEDHEARIFNRYVELGSARAVARYYQIPINHCVNIINKVKKELKCLLQE